MIIINTNVITRGKTIEKTEGGKLGLLRRYLRFQVDPNFVYQVYMAPRRQLLGLEEYDYTSPAHPGDRLVTA